MTVPVVDDPWPRLLGTATLVPSPHNVQSWLVQPVDEWHALLLTNPARLLPNTDPGSRFVTLGHGIFVESLSIERTNLFCGESENRTEERLQGRGRMLQRSRKRIVGVPGGALATGAAAVLVTVFFV